MKDYQQHVNDVYPMWGADGLLYFASERDGTYNLWRISPKGGAPQQVTHFKSGGVFFPSISPDGKKIVFQHEFDLWTLDVPNGSPRKLTIPLAFDRKDSDLQVLTTDNLADGFSPSPTGDYVAVDFHGDIAIVPSEQGIGERTPVATTAWRERGEEYSPDGKKIAYISDESGDQEVWVYDLATASRKRLTTQPSEKANIVWAANSQKLAYTGDNKIWEVDLAAPQPQPKELASNPAGGFTVQQYSGDGTWLVYSRRDDDQNSEIYLYDIAAKKEYNVTAQPERRIERRTHAGRQDRGVHLEPRRRGQPAVRRVARQAHRGSERSAGARARAQRVGRRGRAAAGGGGGSRCGRRRAPRPASRPARIDLDGIEKRANQLTRGTSVVTGFFLSNDGRTVYFATGAGGGRGGPGTGPGADPAPARGARRGRRQPTDQASGLFAIGIDGRDRRSVATGSFPGMRPTCGPPRDLLPRVGGSAARRRRRAAAAAVRRARRSTGCSSPRRSATSASASRSPSRVDRRAEWKQMFEETWRVMKYRYYDAEHERLRLGGDQGAGTSRCSQYVGTNEDVYDLGNAMIGEMSSSHTGVSGPADADAATGSTRRVSSASNWSRRTASTASITSTATARPTRSGSTSRSATTCSPSTARTSRPATTTGRSSARRRTSTSRSRCRRRRPAKARKVVRIASVTNLGNIRYEEFVANNRDIVEKATNGQIAYVHIRSMDQASLERFTERDRPLLEQEGDHHRRPLQHRRQHRRTAARHHRAATLHVSRTRAAARARGDAGRSRRSPGRRSC